MKSGGTIFDEEAKERKRMILYSIPTVRQNFWIFAVLFFFIFSRMHSDGAEPARAEFAANMAKLKEGMTEKEVLNLLGKPDDIRTQFDPGGIGRSRTKEIWGYGSNAHLSFPTLGCVYIDEDGRSQESFGGRGQPPKPSMFNEDELRELLRLLDTAPGVSGDGYNPLSVIQIVNKLRPLGKDRALAAIMEYLRLSGWGSDSPDGMFLVLTVLFDLPKGIYPHQIGIFGMPSAPPPKDPGGGPLYPMAIVDDIPLMLVRGYTLFGQSIPPEYVVDFFRTNGTIRAKPLVPSNDPLAALPHLINSKQWIFGDTNLQQIGFFGYEFSESAGSEKTMLKEQLLRLVDSVYRLPIDRYGTRLQFGASWEKAVTDVSTLKIKWDPRQNIFVFRDGTHLPPLVQKIYRREIWNLSKSKMGRVELVLERKDDTWVDITVRSWLEPKISQAKIDLFNEENTNSLIAGFSIGTGSVESSTISLKPGSEVRARAVIDYQVQESPVLKP